MDEEHRILKEKAFEVISEEDLPVPKQIRFVHRFGGVKRTMANVTHHKLNKTYSIKLHTHLTKYYKDKSGKFKNGFGERFSKSVVGRPINFRIMVNNMAHELAHLKFWKHDTQHKSYTNYLDNILIEKLKSDGVNID